MAVEVQVPEQAPVLGLHVVEQRQASHLLRAVFIQYPVAQTHSLMSLMPAVVVEISLLATGHVRHK